MHGGGYNKEMLRVQSKAILMSLVAAVVVHGPVRAEVVPDLYVAKVPAASLSGDGLDEAFAMALDAVLVKVTGQRNVSARRNAVGPAGPLVRQCQPVPGGDLRVSFDPGSLRQQLDAARLPVWADNRPRTVVILQWVGQGPIMPKGVITVWLMNRFIDGLAFVLPALDRFTRSDWLVYGDGGWEDLLFVVVQGGIYWALLSAAALIDLYRKNF